MSFRSRQTSFWSFSDVSSSSASRHVTVLKRSAAALTASPVTRIALSMAGMPLDWPHDQLPVTAS